MTLDEYEQALNRRYRGALFGKRFLTHLAVIASGELGEPVVIEQAEVSVQDRRLRIYKANTGEST